MPACSDDGPIAGLKESRMSFGIVDRKACQVKASGLFYSLLQVGVQKRSFEDGKGNCLNVE